jgi:hypothetical protein
LQQTPKQKHPKTGNKNDKNMSFGISQLDEGKYFVRKK